jgi:hypothetical protein
VRPGAVVVAVVAISGVCIAAAVLVDRTILREYNARVRAEIGGRPWWLPVDPS